MYFSLRQTLVSRRDELAIFDRAFEAWFLREPVLPPARDESPEPALHVVDGTAGEAGSDGEEEPDDEAIEAGASRQELLRDKDFAELTDEELRRVRDLIARIASMRPLRRSRRTRRDPLGETSRRSRHDPPLASHRRRPRRQTAAGTEGGAAEARAALRRVRLDGQLRASPPALPARCGRRRARGRGLRVRHATLAPHARPRDARSDGRDRPLHRGGRRLGERDADRRIAARVQRGLRPARDCHGARSS